jgi:2-oxoisovalerate dehydrogenase E1 component beta subunit
MAITTYLEAINQALHEEMERDPNVFVMGQDIGIYGGVFKVTKGLLEKFGDLRVIDTPISESMIAGAAAGAATQGMRPVPEIQFSDFIHPAFDQIHNQISTLYWRSAGHWRCPVTIRCPWGGEVGGGPFHSQSVESFFVHTPGLVVVAPSTARDAKGLLKSAIRSDDPVIYFEHKKLYRSVREDLPENEEILTPLGKARVARQGRHVTVISYGLMFQKAMRAAEDAAQHGIEAEVIDMRTLLPIDRETIFASVRKTGKCMIVQEAPRTLGFGDAVAAILAEELFWELDAPVRRITGYDTPYPFAPTMESFYSPSVDTITAVIQDLAEM